METALSDIVTDPVHETTCLKCHHLMDVSNLPAFVEIACPECGTQQRVPGKMGAFLLVELLGKGGMGAVYRGRDTGLDRWVAVKVMQSSFGGNPAFVETFRREAQAAAALNHPNIVQIYSFGIAHGQPYMVMELLEGGRLDQMISRGEMLNEAQVMKIGAEVAEGLMAAANINLIHGDVKPENILFDHNGIAKVVDFGLARFKENNEGGTAQGIWGTPYYIAPEKLRGHPSDARSDIYSLGGTLYHALALKPPFDGETPMDVVKARLKQPAPALHEVRPGINREVEAIVGRMLEADPLKRYPNYASVMSDVRRVLFALPPPVTPAFGPTAKKGGKFILSKKKGASSTEIPSSAPTGVPQRVARSGQTGGQGSGGVARASSGILKVALFGLLGCFLLAGAVAGFLAYRKSLEHQRALAKDKAQIASYRNNVETMAGNLQALMIDVSNREVLARGWASNATHTVASITTGLTQLSNPGECAGIETNAMACADLVSQYANETLVSSETTLKGLSEQVHSNRLVLSTLTNSTLAGLRWAAVTNVPERMAELQKSLAEGESKSRKAAETLGVLKQKLDKALRVSVAAAEKAAAEKAAAEKAAAEKAAAEKAAAELAAKIAAELKQIEESRKTNVAMVQQHQFKPFVEALDQIIKGFKTPEGKAAGKQTLKAYQALVEMKTLFIEGVKTEVKADPEKGYSFGWQKRTDILGANEESLVIREGQGQGRVLWTAVPVQQILAFFQHYVENGDLIIREKAQYEFALALYIYDAMGDNEKARAQVVKHLSSAIHGNPNLEGLAKSVMPDVEVK